MNSMFHLGDDKEIRRDTSYPLAIIRIATPSVKITFERLSKNRWFRMAEGVEMGGEDRAERNVSTVFTELVERKEDVKSVNPMPEIENVRYEQEKKKKEESEIKKLKECRDRLEENLEKLLKQANKNSNEVSGLHAKLTHLEDLITPKEDLEARLSGLYFRGEKIKSFLMSVPGWFWGKDPDCRVEIGNLDENPAKYRVVVVCAHAPRNQETIKDEYIEADDLKRWLTLIAPYYGVAVHSITSEYGEVSPEGFLDGLDTGDIVRADYFSVHKGLYFDGALLDRIVVEVGGTAIGKKEAEVGHLDMEWIDVDEEYQGEVRIGKYGEHNYLRPTSHSPKQLLNFLSANVRTNNFKIVLIRYQGEGEFEVRDPEGVYVALKDEMYRRNMRK